MNSDTGDVDAARALRILGEACADAVTLHGDDLTRACSSLEKRIHGLPPGDRAELERALRKILGFLPPPSRSQH